MGPAAGVTEKFSPLLAWPPTVTMTGPLAALVGTGATMLVPLQLVGAAAVPLNVTVLPPWVAPKPAPAIVTDVPIGPVVGLSPVRLGAAAAAALNATTAAAQVSAAPSAALADALPAEA